jgi:hypothetical protein
MELMSPSRPSRGLCGRALVLVPALLLCSGGASAYSREEVAGQPGTFLFWANRVISYSINRRGSADLSIVDVRGAIKRAFFSWASPSCTDIDFHFAGLDSTERTNLMLGENEAPDRKNLIIWHESSWPPPGVSDPSLNDKVPAITTLIYDPASGLIYDADIDINGYNFFWTTTDDTTQAAMDLESVMAHEIGHLLGLGHSQEPEATMYATVAQAELKKRSLEKDDLAGVCFVYPFESATPHGAGQGTIRNDVQGGCRLVPPKSAPEAGPPACLLGLLLLLGLMARRRKSR